MLYFKIYSVFIFSPITISVANTRYFNIDHIIQIKFSGSLIHFINILNMQKFFLQNSIISLITKIYLCEIWGTYRYEFDKSEPVNIVCIAISMCNVLVKPLMDIL